MKFEPRAHYTALWLNRRGFLRALELPGLSMDGHLYFYASNGLAQRNNNRTADAMRDEQLEFVRMYEEHGVPVTTAGMTRAFGCNFDGDIPEARVTGLLPWIREITVGRGHPLPTLMLCDTMGWANPEAVRRLIGAVREREPAQRIGMHIHDTRGLGLANFHAALEMGVDVFMLRSAAWAGVRSPGTATPARPATFAPRMPCSCATNSGSRPASTSRD